MSHPANDQLLAEAYDYINSGDLSSTPLEEMIQADVKYGDMEALWEHLQVARDRLRDDSNTDFDPELMEAVSNIESFRGTL